MAIRRFKDTVQARLLGDLAFGNTLLRELHPEETPIRLSRDEQIAFVTALLDLPTTPGERLRLAAATYRQQTGL